MKSGREASGLKRRFFTLCLTLALALALGCLAAVQWLTAPRETADPAPAVPSAPAEKGPTLAFLGDGEDAWCAPFFDWLDRWASEEGWTLISYDCEGSAAAQRGQLEDLLRTERVDLVVLYPADRDLETAPLPERDIPVVVLGAGDWPGTCRVGPGPDEPYRSAGDWFGRGAEVLLLADLPDDPRVEEARAGLAAAGVTVLDYGACWSSPVYAKDYVDLALARFPEPDGVLAFSRAGALGTGDALGEARKAKVLCLESGPEALEELALGGLDAVAEVPARSAFQALRLVIPAVLAGERDVVCEVPVELHT